MSFQQAVNFKQGLGVTGEIYNDGPRRCQSFILESLDASYNVFGRAFSRKSGSTNEGKAQAGNAGGTLVFAGILVNPKASALLGTAAGGSLAPSLTLPNEAQGELLTEGSVIVTLPAAAAIGDLVIFDNITGILETITPGSALPVGKSPAHATVDYFAVTAAGLAVITVLTAPEIPVLA